MVSIFTSRFFKSLLFFILIDAVVIESAGQTSGIRISGAMRNVMMKGQLEATINLDTIKNKQHLYGLGPLEFLQGEILIKDGMAFKATVNADSSIRVEKEYNLRAPFFVYATIDHWQEYSLPDSVHTINQLDQYLNAISESKVRPFAFKLVGKIDEATIHLVNLPKDTKVKSSADAHRGKVSFKLKEEYVEMIGFFSTEHKGVFTHHDSNMHIHLITEDESKMGHLDSVDLNTTKCKLLLSE